MGRLDAKGVLIDFSSGGDFKKGLAKTNHPA
jgi:hypothetical protein